MNRFKTLDRNEDDWSEMLYLNSQQIEELTIFWRDDDGIFNSLIANWNIAKTQNNHLNGKNKDE